ncbi:MAG: hypothetical protein C4519_28655 [Desulfobacteraceae bacterium]|nr:MAG: hypothetical protein C4519_28655 [Desulfobacteraceae bacterium]
MTAQQRSLQDRRSGKDRRRFPRLKQLFTKDPHQRDPLERRQQPERREGWIRLTRWSSVFLKRLKIAKFLDPP